MNKSHIYIIDMALIVSTLLIIIATIGYSSPLVVAPISENITTSEVLFTLKDTNEILIDDNLNFSSPKSYLLTNGLKLELQPNIYYLKATEDTFSQIITLDVKSDVVLELKKNGENFDIINSGKKSLKVEVYDLNSMVDEMRLNPYSGGGKK